MLQHLKYDALDLCQLCCDAFKTDAVFEDETTRDQQAQFLSAAEMVWANTFDKDDKLRRATTIAARRLMLLHTDSYEDEYNFIKRMTKRVPSLAIDVMASTTG